MEIKKFPKFQDIEVSTKTVIIYTNLKLEISKIFNKLPITTYDVIKKKRGRKRKELKETPAPVLAQGSIITLKYESQHRGVLLKAKKAKLDEKKTDCFFRNSLTIVTYIDGKFINYKVSDNGRIQITGCKNNTQTQLVLDSFLHNLKTYCSDSYTLASDLFCIFRTVMRNIDFNIGFHVNREALDQYVNNEGPLEYISLYETSFGYQGVNIKIPIEMEDHYLKKRTYVNGQWQETTVMYTEFIQQILSEKERKKEEDKKRYNTFLVFNSGNIIMSSMNRQFSQKYYAKFLDLIEQCETTIKEK